MHHPNFLTAALLAVLPLVADAFPFPGTIVRRADEMRARYDYVVIGGGTSGLAVANRLSEDSKKTVLVIEAGQIFDEHQEDIMIPGNSAALGFKYEWDFVSEPIPSLKDNGTFEIPAPKCVGGDSATNSMSFDRGTREDYDSWEAMGNPGWGWDGLDPYFKKAVTFHPPTREQQSEFGISYDPSAHGTSGPVHVKFAKFIYPQYRTFADAFKKLGVPIPRDTHSGEGIGSLWIPSPIDPRDESRSYSRTAYHDRAVKRKNYHLLPLTQVTRILFDDHKRAIGVMYAKKKGDKPMKALASLEVVLTAGALHNPKLLQLSGVGPAALLRAHGIPVVVDLPGVGSNLQDHALVRPMNYTSDPNPKNTPYIDPTPALTNATWQAEALAEYRANHTGYYTRPLAGSTVAFLPLPIIAPHSYKEIIAEAKDVPHETAGMHRDVARGYARQKKRILAAYATKKLAVGEISLRPGVTPGPALIVQKPLSRGRVEIASADPWTNPKIFYGTLSHPTDVRILTANIRYARAYFASAGMRIFKPVETFPGKDVDSEKELAAVARGRIVNPSVGHASGTCPMMKRDEGGVVDAELNVYGVKGLRVVDVSISPIVPSCHMTSTRYAVAEKGAAIIRKSYKE